MATLSTLRNVVAKKIGLDNTASGDQPLIDEWINQGIREILLRTHCTVEQGSLTTTASTWQYELDTDFLAIEEMYREESDGAVQLARRETAVEIIDRHRGSNTSADSTLTYYATAGSNLLLVWPTPASAYTLKLLYVPRPTELSSSNHDPSDATYGRIPAEFHKLIELWTLAEAADYDDDAGSQHGDRYRFQFEEGIKRMRAAIRGKGGKRLAPARLNPRRRNTTIPSDPSVSTAWS